MSLSFCILGSGSAGNSTLVCLGTGAQRDYLLIDVGLSPRATLKRLAPLGVALEQISAVLLTHFDTDHFNSGWLKVLARLAIPVHVHKQHQRIAWKSGLSMKHVELYAQSIGLKCSAAVSGHVLAHDDLGSVGFVIEHEGYRLGYATDLGRVPESLFEHFHNLDALAIESNYDVRMQLTSGRPRFLTQRIMGGRGHLSNDQSFDAVHRLAQHCGLSHIALLHLSQQCNDPELVRNLYRERVPCLADRLTISDQYEPTGLLEVRRGEPLSHQSLFKSGMQLPLFSASGTAPELVEA